MFNHLGYSVYLSNFTNIKEQLPSLYKEGSTVFTSFHVSEEYDFSYMERAEQMCSFLSDIGYKIIADVSRKTLDFFHMDNLIDFAHKMKIDILRIDYGYSEEEIAELAAQMPLCVNASTLTAESAGGISRDAVELYAMHNFYPRPETGLDREQFLARNQMLKKFGIKVLAFIPGDLEKRGPIFEGLPTLEDHRKADPYAAYIDLMHNYNIDQVFVGDGVLSQFQADLIDRYRQDNIISLPVSFPEEGNYLFQQIYTVRVDSPRWLMRLQESREYSCFGQEIKPCHCVPREIGAVTVDNIHYQRYSGEVQIIKEPLAADERVNVIGMIPKSYQLLLHNISNGDKIRFIQEKSIDM
jgi:hypothetical protein